MRCEFADTGVTAAYGMCVTQNGGLEHNFEILRYSWIALFFSIRLSIPIHPFRTDGSIASVRGSVCQSVHLSIRPSVNHCRFHVQTAHPWHRSHFGSRYRLGCCGYVGLFRQGFKSCRVHHQAFLIVTVMEDCEVERSSFLELF